MLRPRCGRLYEGFWSVCTFARETAGATVVLHMWVSQFLVPWPLGVINLWRVLLKLGLCRASRKNAYCRCPSGEHRGPTAKYLHPRPTFHEAASNTRFCRKETCATLRQSNHEREAATIWLL
jgi:hypothetical protein